MPPIYWNGIQGNFQILQILRPFYKRAWIEPGQVCVSLIKKQFGNSTWKLFFFHPHVTHMETGSQQMTDWSDMYCFSLPYNITAGSLETIVYTVCVCVVCQQWKQKSLLNTCHLSDDAFLKNVICKENQSQIGLGRNLKILT